MMAYDSNNTFAKILRGEIPCQRVYEDDHALAFNDINPKAPIHVLVIPKRPYRSFMDFTIRASSEETAAFFQTLTKVAEILKFSNGGFRLVVNNGPDSGEEVPHFHVHLIGGKRLGGIA
jgi:histidine triad (HIT) family protein